MNLRDFEDAIGYLLNPEASSAPGEAQPLPKRRQRAPKAFHNDYVQAREDTIAELIRTIAREGRMVTSAAVSARSKGQDGRYIPETTIRNSKSWKKRQEIAAEVRGDISYLDKYRRDGSTPPIDESELN